MRKFFYFLVAGMLAMSAQWATAQGDFDGGNGSVNDPYKISTPEQLNLIRNYLGDADGIHFVLTEDINLETYLSEDNPGYNGGLGWEPIGKPSVGSTPGEVFRGTLDGAGHKITGLWTDRPTEKNVGLFRIIKESTITNLKVEIAEKGVKALGYVGGLAGYIQGSSITNCAVSGGAITASLYYGGGLAGSVTNTSNRKSMIESTSASVDIYVVDPLLEGDNLTVVYMGGLVGNASGISVSDCFATGDIILKDETDYEHTMMFLGGLVGIIFGESSVVRSYAAGEVAPGRSDESNGDWSFGGLVGVVNEGDNCEFTNSYYNNANEKGIGDGETETDGVTGKTEEELNDPDLFDESAKFDGEGEGTEDSPYLITTPEQLNSLRNFVGPMYADTHFALDEDIKLESYLSEGNAGYNEGAGWEPIGKNDDQQISQTAFYGSLDGQGHTISGLWINRPEGYNIGLFGYIKDGTLQNIHLEIADQGVKADTSVGGLVGVATNNSFINCSVTGGPVTGSENVGGLASYVYGSVEKCFSSVNIYVTTGYNTYAGCLTGSVNGTLTNSYATGHIMPASPGAEEYTSKKLYLGGLVGSLNRGSTLSYSYASGKVVDRTFFNAKGEGDWNFGGLLGEQSGKIVDSYSNSTDNNRPVGRYVSGAASGEATGLPIGDLQRAEFFTNWVFDGEPWTIEERQTSPYFLGQAEKDIPTYTNPFDGGYGKKGDPWQIRTAEQFDHLRDYLGMPHADKYFILIRNIDLNEVITDEKGWEPIGEGVAGSSLEKAFWGHLIGDHYTISGLWADRADEEAVGLFAQLQGATIEEVKLRIDSRGVKGGSYVGGLAGSISHNTTINRSSVAGGTISGHVQVGALTALAENSTIKESYSSTQIRVLDPKPFNAPVNIGALVGELRGGSLENVYATGSIAPANAEQQYDFAEFNLGGLVGYVANETGNITNSYASGKMADKEAFGEAGANNWSFGGLIGKKEGDANRISGAYYNTDDNENGIESGSSDGMTGKSMTDLQTKATFEGWGFDDAPWTIDEKVSSPYFLWQAEDRPSYDMVFESGEGTEDSPWEITSPEQFNNIRFFLGDKHDNKYFILTADVNLEEYISGQELTRAEGNGWEPIGSYDPDGKKQFSGHIDGQGHTISGLWINREEERHVGLFGYAINATITNMHVDIAPAGIKGKTLVGGLAGQVSNGQGGSISNCVVTGGAISAYGVAGGLIGEMDGGSLNSSYAAVDIIALEKKEEDKEEYLEAIMGGLIGYAMTDIKDCYATGDLIVTNPYEEHYKHLFTLGGLVGKVHEQGSISRCYAVGTTPNGKNVPKSWNIGGLVGHAPDATNQQISDTYYNKNTSYKPVGGEQEYEGVTGVTMRRLLSKATYKGWFAEGTPWAIQEGTTTPYLSWQRTNVQPPFKPDAADLRERDPENDKYDINISLGGNVLADHAVGKHRVMDESEWTLKFQLEDPTIDYREILFFVNGKKSDFSVDGENEYSYTISSVLQDYDIEIALQRYTVTMPEVEDAVTDMAAGDYSILYNSWFEFILAPNENYSLEYVTVYANDEVLLPIVQTKESSIYSIRKVKENTLIRIEGISPVANAVLNENINVRVENEQLIVTNEGVDGIDVTVYSITGKNMGEIRALRGTESFVLPRGVYIVRAGEMTTKVIVK
ncbi:hypothetical protein M2137_000178 [Parabacteroides sp. PFB2-10]|uniref:GLUG motif-containing protein n=1 Tax=Parabacteroides sp. PFB2-10 TaxID=1742405 RepID=UPI002473F962|nr:GLUG motif-containing protein [Parabacteroides sp. PFB2-10]MDH6311428.1 hypothetical protein [Parabacteroides sp. PFB2-10]